MPPRPRPRPVNRQKTAPATSSTPEASSSKASTSADHVKTARELELDKDDEFFIRNRNRTAKDWKKLEQREKEQDLTTPATSSDAEEGSNTPRKRHKSGRNRGKDSNGLPSWTRQDSIPLLSSDEDDDLEIVDDHSGASQTRRLKRQRSRSRSITPPPQLSLQQRQNARNLVRETLDARARSPSPTTYLPDDSTDTIVLDPELLSIARAVKKQATYGGDSMDSGGPENVTIKVNWRPHPLDDEGRPQVWGFKMKRHDPFSIVVDEIADVAEVLADSLILTYEGSRVFSSATPHSLKIWAEAEIDASDKTTFEYLRQHRHQRPPVSSDGRGAAPETSVNGEADESDADVQSVQDANEDEDDTFKLVVRSGSTKDVTLTVRPTTTCGAIVKAFLKRVGLSDKYPEGKSARRKSAAAAGPRLMIDGERMDPEAPIADGDLEDGDQVEVAGL
ncbi:hypothetical protein BV25DRAFT_1994402 [Artomyces pyxidatus]|uniref:Uncharacterized protein n=1 Tax=Artomyces pyxidatus TaxID=48021 RepID=A0ACB8SQT1_9AGAM|nr:hypothetical protein BV25DRAFT_1994402 [Artomyces pyxidatus]